MEKLATRLKRGSSREKKGMVMEMMPGRHFCSEWALWAEMDIQDDQIPPAHLLILYDVRFLLSSPELHPLFSQFEDLFQGTHIYLQPLL